jgi:hypothetical protein
MTPSARSRILDALQKGATLQAAARAGTVPIATLKAEMAHDDELAEAVEQAQAVGATKRLGVVAAPPKPKPKPQPKQVTPAATTATIAAFPITPTERHAQFVAECAKLGPGIFGALLWVEIKCIAAGMHPMDPMWLWHFQQFYASGKIVDVGRFGLRAAKSVSVPRAIVAEILYTARQLEPGQLGVCPVMAQNQREAADRFSTFRTVLPACGFADCTGQRSPEEEAGFVCSGGGATALKIAMRDLQGHPVEIRVYTASIAGAAGFTAIAGFCDETDLWGKDIGANPAERVIEVLITRFTTQPGAKLHIMSATYFPASKHARMIAEGDTPLQRVARLGEAGARKDTADRASLAAEIKSADARLTAAADPLSVDIPAWVSNPVSPIATCYALSNGNLDRMFALYGGRVAEVGKSSLWTVEDSAAFAQFNSMGYRPPEQTIDGARSGTGGGLIRFPGLDSHDPRSTEHGGTHGPGTID